MFAFGLGYSARRIVRGPAIEASGTVRSAEAAEALRREGVQAFVFDGVQGDSGLAKGLAQAQAILISAPPSELIQGCVPGQAVPSCTLYGPVPQGNASKSA